MLVCVVLSGPSPILGQESSSPSSLQQESLLLEGIVLNGDLTLDSGTVVLHHVNTDAMVPGAVFDSATVGPGGEFQFLLPVVPDGNIRGDIYFASVDYEGVLYFGSAITTLEQLDSLYVVQVFQAEEVPPEGVPLPVEVRTMIVEFVGDEWIATDVFALANRGARTLVAQEDGVVWSYPLPLGATEAELGEGDLPPDAVMFEEGRVVVSAPIPPGERVLMIRYRLEDLGSTIPAPGRTEVFELLVKEPAPPLQVVGLEPVDVVTLGPGSSYRRYGGTELVDLNLTIVETEERGLPPVEWLAVLTAVMLAAGGFLAYLRPRRPVAAGVDSELGREALILEVARVDNALAEEAEADTRAELLERRAALLTLLRNSD
jgi:hypothetical protein